MSQLLLATSTTLHALAMIVFIGHYLLMSLISSAPAVQSWTTALRRWVRCRTAAAAGCTVSILVFAATGIHLTLVDPNYLGIGNFSNPWALLMLIKHIVIVVMIALGFWYNALQRVGPALRSNSGAAQGVAKFRQYSVLPCRSAACWCWR